jgi:hypothetical protein
MIVSSIGADAIAGAVELHAAADSRCTNVSSRTLICVNMNTDILVLLQMVVAHGGTVSREPRSRDAVRLSVT